MKINELLQQNEQLKSENQYLKSLLKNAHVPYDVSPWEGKDTGKSSFDPKQGDRILPFEVNEETVQLFYKYFWGRKDVYAKRYESKAGRTGYYPQCVNQWSRNCTIGKARHNGCGNCEHRQWKELDIETVKSHLLGLSHRCDDVIGVYPLFPNGTCRFIVFDFDNHAMGAENKDGANIDEQWKEEVDVLRKVCEENQLAPIVERSRSGRGAHVWIFFKEPVDASLARRFGNALIHKGEEQISVPSFKYYDRLLPTQNEVQGEGLGNLIALPLQGRARKEGNSVFVDSNWNAYPDQIAVLKQTPRLTKEELEDCIRKWFPYIPGTTFDKPWRGDEKFHPEDVRGDLQITLANRIYVDIRNLQPRIINQIRRIATYQNREYYKTLRMGRKVFDMSQMIDLSEADPRYASIPRGCLEELVEKLSEGEISYSISDERCVGNSIDVHFNGELWEKQQIAANEMMKYETGILDAATAFGKTVVGSYLISQRKVSTLILVQHVELIEQWKKELEKFLEINEECPEYQTKTGRIKKRESPIGILHGAKDTTTGIVDIAMVGSAYKKGDFHFRLQEYGMVILDECHHAAAETSYQVLNACKAKFVYGVSATPEREDFKTKTNYMLLGPVRHRFSVREQNQQYGLDCFVYPRFTRTVLPRSKDEKPSLNEAYTIVREDSLRTEQIVNDVKMCLGESRCPLILTRFKSHAREIYERSKDLADHVFLLYGDQNEKERKQVRAEMERVSAQESMILISINSMIGEGFNFPRFDTLFLTIPISGEGPLIQYVGRLNRKFPGKKQVVVYDYVDRNIGIFENMYTKRLREYQQMGYEVISSLKIDHQKTNVIYDMESYLERYKEDLVTAAKEIIVSSPSLRENKIDQFVNMVKNGQEHGVGIVVVTWHPDTYPYDSAEVRMRQMEKLRQNGIRVYYVSDHCEHYTIIDHEIVWYGSLNFLGKEDAEDNLMRIYNKEIAKELMEITFGQESIIESWEKYE